MNRTLVAAALLAFCTAAVHLFLGTGEIAVPLLESPLKRSEALLLYACWHLVSFVLLFSAAALLYSALPGHRLSGRLMARFVAVLWITFGVVFLLMGLLAKGATLLTLPQWILLLPVGLLALRGAAPRALVH